MYNKNDTAKLLKPICSVIYRSQIERLWWKRKAGAESIGKMTLRAFFKLLCVLTEPCDCRIVSDTGCLYWPFVLCHILCLALSHHLWKFQAIFFTLWSLPFTSLCPLCLSFILFQWNSSISFRVGNFTGRFQGKVMWGHVKEDHIITFSFIIADGLQMQSCQVWKESCSNEST